MAENPPETQQGQELVGALAVGEQTGKFRQSAEFFNLLEDENAISPEMAREIGTECKRSFDQDNESRASWLEMHSYWLSLYMQTDYAENSDPERDWGATESLPILTEACDQFQSRTYKAFFPNDTFVSAVPMRRTSKDRKILEDRADRVGKHLSYQLGYKYRTYKQDKDALFLGVAIHGSFFTKSYPIDPTKSTFSLPYRVDNVRPTDLVVDYNVGAVRIEDVRRKTHIIYTTVAETEQLVEEGYFTQPAMASDEDPSGEYNQKVDEATGMKGGNNQIKSDKPAVIGEQHTFLNLDGIYKPYIATFCISSGKLLRLTIGYEATPDGQPLNDYKQIQYFTHYKFAENPDGFYGLGLGAKIGDINSAVNIMMRQTMDAATLANDGNLSGFISERLTMPDADEVAMAMGKFIKIPDASGDISNGIYQHRFIGPNEALIKLMQFLDARGQRMGATTEATTGSLTRAEQPTSLLAQIEQAMELFSSVQMRLSYSLTDELMKIYRINQRFAPLVDFFVVNGEGEQILRADYADDMLVMPIFDPKFATQMQKVQRAEAELKATMENPNNQMRPEVIDAAFRRYFEALQVENIEELIPPPPEPVRIDEQYLENMYFLMPAAKRPPFGVYPDQNHAEHLAKIQEFTMQYGAMLDEEQRMALLTHTQEHEAYQYGQIKQLVPTGQVSPASLVGQPNNPMDIGQAAGPIQAEAPLSEANVFGRGISPMGAAGGNPQPESSV